MAMDAILTPAEMEALLQSTEPSGPANVVKPIDLISRDHRAFALLPELQEGVDRLAAHVARICTQQLRSSCKATAEPVEVVPASRLNDFLGTPRFLYGIRIGSCTGAGVITVDGVLGGCYVERQFGGELLMIQTPDGPPTNTEKRTVSRLATRIIAATQKALEPVSDLNAAIEFEIPPMLKNANRAVAIILFSIRLSIGDQRSTINIALDTAASGFRLKEHPTLQKSGNINSALTGILQKVPLQVSAILGKTEIPVQQFMNLKPGDVVSLETPVDAAIPLLIEGAPKFVGTPTIHRGNLSLQVQQAIKE